MAGKDSSESSATEEKARIVLVAMDGTDKSKFALNYYVSNIRHDNDKLVIVTTVEMSKTSNASEESSSPFTYNNESLIQGPDEENQRLRKKLSEFVAILRELGVEGTVKSVNAESPGAGIVKAAKELQADLIVVGTRGLSKLRRTFSGSVSDYVLHHAHVPVLVCRRDG